VRSLLNRLDRLSAAGALSSQIESQESPRPSKRNFVKPGGRKTLLSRSELKAALRKLS
jgi:hypothetical protein